jgi:hypothetical protein
MRMAAKNVTRTLRVAHAFRVLAKPSRVRELSMTLGPVLKGNAAEKVRFGGTPKPARNKRALPNRTGGFSGDLLL